VRTEFSIQLLNCEKVVVVNGDNKVPSLDPNVLRHYGGTGQAADWAGCGDRCGGHCLDAAGADEFAFGTVAGRLFVSREEHDGLFSTGYVGGGERGAFGFVVRAEPVAAVG